MQLTGGEKYSQLLLVSHHVCIHGLVIRGKKKIYCLMYQHLWNRFVLSCCSFTILLLKTGQNIYYILWKDKKNQFSFIYRDQSQTFASEMWQDEDCDNSETPVCNRNTVPHLSSPVNHLVTPQIYAVTPEGPTHAAVVTPLDEIASSSAAVWSKKKTPQRLSLIQLLKNITGA